MDKKAKAQIQFIECWAPVRIINERLNRKNQKAETVPDGHWKIFNQQRRDFDPTMDQGKSFYFRQKTVTPP